MGRKVEKEANLDGLYGHILYGHITNNFELSPT